MKPEIIYFKNEEDDDSYVLAVPLDPESFDSAPVAVNGGACSLIGEFRRTVEREWVFIGVPLRQTVLSVGCMERLIEIRAAIVWAESTDYLEVLEHA